MAEVLQRPAISQNEFALFQKFIYEAAGITMSDAKKALVGGRLARRLQLCGVASYGEYFRILQGGDKDELQQAIDLLTTNETYFFRESKHFDLLRAEALAARAKGHGMRIWSAASSSGEECYSIAMVLDDCLGDGMAWEVIGTDISTRVLQKASIGHYPMERARHIPHDYLRKYCLKGQGAQEGTLLIEPKLRRRVQFGQVNLNTALPKLGQFDLVFLRNVMIYFNGDTKRAVVERIAATLKPGGKLIIGHSESLGDLGVSLRQLAPSIYIRD